MKLTANAPCRSSSSVDLVIITVCAGQIIKVPIALKVPTNIACSLLSTIDQAATALPSTKSPKIITGFGPMRSINQPEGPVKTIATTAM